MQAINRRLWEWILLIGSIIVLLYCATAISAGVLSDGPLYWSACETYFHAALCAIGGVIAGIGVKVDYLRFRQVPIFMVILVAIKFFSLIVASATPLNFSAGHWAIEGIIFIFLMFVAFLNTPPYVSN